MIYDLWHQPTATLIGAFDSEAAALAYVRMTAQRDAKAPLSWTLAVEDDAGRQLPIAAGQALTDLAALAAAS